MKEPIVLPIQTIFIVHRRLKVFLPGSERDSRRFCKREIVGCYQLPETDELATSLQGNTPLLTRLHGNRQATEGFLSYDTDQGAGLSWIEVSGRNLLIPRSSKFVSWPSKWPDPAVTLLSVQYSHCLNRIWGLNPGFIVAFWDGSIELVIDFLMV